MCWKTQRNITCLKSNSELWEQSQLVISRAVSMSKIENARVYKRIEAQQQEERRMIEKHN